MASPAERSGPSVSATARNLSSLNPNPTQRAVRSARRAMGWPAGTVGWSDSGLKALAAFLRYGRTLLVRAILLVR